jgi:hypothetical protein
MLFTVIARRRSAAGRSADDRSRAPAHSCGDGGRNSFIALPCPATASSGSRPHLAVTTPTSQPIARGSQIPIAPARRTVVSMPARGFLPRGLSDARPPRATHRQVTGRRLITLNDSGPSVLTTGTANFEPSSDIRARRMEPTLPQYWLCGLTDRTTAACATTPTRAASRVTKI